jgi:protocatechuate 3,4-dioxygenase beta subunit
MKDHAHPPRQNGHVSQLAALRRTPGMLLGPFYPLKPTADADARLWRASGVPQGARQLQILGRVLDVAGHAVAGASVELWQADPAGRYRHPSAAETIEVPVEFTGYGLVRSGDDGRFAFDSLVPGAYHEGDVARAPHLHFQITGRFDRLVTQLFLPRHPANALDPWYRALMRPEAVTAEVTDDATDRLILRWTAVLSRG